MQSLPKYVNVSLDTTDDGLNPNFFKDEDGSYKGIDEAMIYIGLKNTNVKQTIGINSIFNGTGGVRWIEYKNSSKTNEMKLKFSRKSGTLDFSATKLSTIFFYDGNNFINPFTMDLISTNDLIEDAKDKKKHEFSYFIMSAIIFINHEPVETDLVLDIKKKEFVCEKGTLRYRFDKTLIGTEIYSYINEDVIKLTSFINMVPIDNMTFLDILNKFYSNSENVLEKVYTSKSIFIESTNIDFVELLINGNPIKIFDFMKPFFCETNPIFKESFKSRQVVFNNLDYDLTIVIFGCLKHLFTYGNFPIKLIHENLNDLVKIYEIADFLMIDVLTEFLEKIHYII